jgi:hypothetical protein
VGSGRVSERFCCLGGLVWISFFSYSLFCFNAMFLSQLARVRLGSKRRLVGFIARRCRSDSACQFGNFFRLMFCFLWKGAALRGETGRGMSCAYVLLLRWSVNLALLFVASNICLLARCLVLRSLSRELTRLGKLIDCQVVCFLGLQLSVAYNRGCIWFWAKYVVDARLFDSSRILGASGRTPLQHEESWVLSVPSPKVGS